MNKRTRNALISAGIQVLLLVVCAVCFLSCNWNKRHKNNIPPIETPMSEPMEEGALWPPEMRSIHEIYDSLMMVYSETDSNRVINDPGSILVDAIEIDSERSQTE